MFVYMAVRMYVHVSVSTLSSWSQVRFQIGEMGLAADRPGLPRFVDPGEFPLGKLPCLSSSAVLHSAAALQVHTVFGGALFNLHLARYKVLKLHQSRPSDRAD